MLEEETVALQAELQKKYGKANLATSTDNEKYTKKQNNLRAARQRQRQKVQKILRTDYFKKKDNKKFERQLRGIHIAPQPMPKVVFSLPERRRIADILGDLNDDFPEDAIIGRKVNAINAWVDYTWKIEPKEQKSSPNKSVMISLLVAAKEVRMP